MSEAPAIPRRSPLRLLRLLPVVAIMALLFGVPWWALVASSTDWPVAVIVGGTVVFVAAFVALPLLMMLGHGRRHLDWAAALGDKLLGAVWVLFVWTLLGDLLRLALIVAGVDNPERSRIVAAAIVVVVLTLLVWGYFEAMRVPRIKNVDVTISRLGAGLDGLRVAVVTDTHYGPIERSGWSARVAEAVNELDADIVCHVGDIADGSVAQRAVAGSGFSTNFVTARTLPRPWPAPTLNCPFCCSPTNRSRYRRPSKRVSISNYPVIPMAGRSGLSTSWSDWISRSWPG